MLMVSRRVLAFFVFLSLLIASISIPLVDSEGGFASAAEHKTGVLSTIRSIDGNVCRTEENTEYLLRGEMNIFPGMGTSYFNIVTCFGFFLLLINYFLKFNIQIIMNPVSVAVFNHLGDGMK